MSTRGIPRLPDHADGCLTGALVVSLDFKKTPMAASREHLMEALSWRRCRRVRWCFVARLARRKTWWVAACLDTLPNNLTILW